MTINLATALIYWVIVALWLIVLGTVITKYLRNPRIFGTTRLLLAVIGIDTCRNIIENIYFGLFFGGHYGLLPKTMTDLLGIPSLLILPKLINVGAGSAVLILLLMRWLPIAVKERSHSEQLDADLETLVRQESLTSLVDRDEFESMARTEWVRFQRYGRPLSLLVLGIDNLAAIRKRFGRYAADVMLKNIADTCRAAKRDTDVVARIRETEFAFLLPETGEAAASIFGTRLQQEILNHQPRMAGECPNVIVSIGVAVAKLKMPAFDVLVKRAEKGLLEAAALATVT